jgi:DNA-binding HxlR family transcriptional regulator
MESFRSPCPVASFLDLFGDRWTLLVLRDLATGKSRFAEFEASPERIAPSLLADRMRRLEALGLVTREAYSQRPLRHAYRLTPKGESLRPVVVAMGLWAQENLPGRWRMPDRFVTPPPSASPGPD